MKDLVEGLRKAIVAMPETRQTSNALIVLASYSNPTRNDYLDMVHKVTFCLECNDPKQYKLRPERVSIPKGLSDNASWVFASFRNAWTRGKKTKIPIETQRRIKMLPLRQALRELQAAYLEAYVNNLKASEDDWAQARKNISSCW